MAFYSDLDVRLVDEYISANVPSDWEIFPFEEAIFPKNEITYNRVYLRRKDGIQIIITLKDKNNFLFVSVCAILSLNKDLTVEYMNTVSSEVIKIFFGDRKFDLLPGYAHLPLNKYFSSPIEGC